MVLPSRCTVQKWHNELNKTKTKIKQNSGLKLDISKKITNIVSLAFLGNTIIVKSWEFGENKCNRKIQLIERGHMSGGRNAGGSSVHGVGVRGMRMTGHYSACSALVFVYSAC